MEHTTHRIVRGTAAWPIRWVLVVVLALLAVVMAVPAGASDSDSELLGELVRDDLSAIAAEVVSDAALDMVNQEQFSPVRELWEDDERLALQLDYQLEFRSYVDFMSSDAAGLADLLSDRPLNHGIEELGLYMTAAEVAEMQRRSELGDRMGTIVEVVTGVDELVVPEGESPTYGADFGGIWQDQLDGGRIVLAVVEGASVDVGMLATIAGGLDSIKVVEQRFSYDELQDYKRLLWKELGVLGIAGDVAVVWDDHGMHIEVRVPDPVAASRLLSSTVDKDAYVVVKGEPMVEAGVPNSTHTLADQQPGLDIMVKDGVGRKPCTWGFNGHTSTYHYIVTAGHCLAANANQSGASVAQVDVWQNDQTSRDLTNNPYVRSFDNATYDIARIESQYANDNCYHGDPDQSSHHCAWTMSSRALHNSWELGSDQSCASLGTTNDYRCGYIFEENAGTSGNRVRVAMTIMGGDSGSGMKWSNRIDGIITDRSTSQAFFQTAYHAQVQLGNGYFYFNCAVGQTTYTSASSWSACPYSDA